LRLTDALRLAPRRGEETQRQNEALAIHQGAHRGSRDSRTMSGNRCEPAPWDRADEGVAGQV